MTTRRDNKEMRVVLTIAAVSFACSALILLLTGCTKEPPVYITGELPTAPAECVSPPTPEPKLDDTRDATVLDAVKDRHKLKVAYRTERNLRSSCGKQLKVLLPKAQ